MLHVNVLQYEHQLAIVRCSGKITLGEEAAQFRKTMNDLRKRVQDIVINLKEVSYIDASGIGEIIVADEESKKRGQRIKLSNLSEDCREIFTFMGIHTRFEIFENEEKALRSFFKSELVDSAISAPSRM